MAERTVADKRRDSLERWTRATPEQWAAAVREALDFATFLERSGQTGAGQAAGGGQTGRAGENEQPSAFPRFRSRYDPTGPEGRR